MLAVLQVNLRNNLGTMSSLDATYDGLKISAAMVWSSWERKSNGQIQLRARQSFRKLPVT
jgi:hypothetical protein